MNIYVGNISYDSTEIDLRSVFEAFGQIQTATIVTDRSTGRSKGFGFVEMLSKKEAQAAIDGLNDHELKGRALAVNEARPRVDHPDRNNRFGGSRGGFSDEGYRQERN